MKIIHQEVKLDLAWSKAIVKKYYDQKRGNHLLLKRRSCLFETTDNWQEGIQYRRSSKFDCEVLEKLENDNFKLKLPPRLRIHPTFHVSLLEKTKNPVSDENDSTYGDEYEVPSFLLIAYPGLKLRIGRTHAFISSSSSSLDLAIQCS